MGKTLCVVVGSCLAFALTACGGGGAGGNGTSAANQPKNSYATYTETDFMAESEDLIKTEKSLEDVGLKMAKKRDSQTSLQTGEKMMWDQSYFDTYSAQHPEMTTEKKKDAMKAALDNYVNVAKSYLAKYGTSFNMKKNDGTLEVWTMKDYAKAELEAKIGLAEKSAAKLQE